MPMFQKLNTKTNAYVKMKSSKKGVRIVNVKQREPMIPFKGVKIIK